MATPHRLLVVDDDPSFCDLTVRRLRKAGFVVDFRHDPFEGNQLAGQNAYDAVILDVSMPGLSGPALLDLLRGQPHLQRARVVFYSSLDRSELARLAQEHGAAGFVSKSASTADLELEVWRVLSVHTGQLRRPDSQ